MPRIAWLVYVLSCTRFFIRSNPRPQLIHHAHFLLFPLGTPGFGPRMVRTLAIDIFKDCVPIGADVDVDAACAAGGVSRLWTPSDSFCYSFLTKNMKLTHKVATTLSVSAEVKEAQQKQIDVLKLRLANEVKEGVPYDLIFMSDEAGLHLFPQDKFVSADKGCQSAPAAVRGHDVNRISSLILATSRRSRTRRPFPSSTRESTRSVCSTTS